MAEIKWIKLDVRIFDNRKIKQIRTLPDGDSIILVWLQLLCLAGTVNDEGKVYMTDTLPYTDQMLATEFNISLPIIQLAMETFKQFDMIDVIDDVIYITNWEKYQAVEELERIREANRVRQKRWYDKNKKVIPNVSPNAMLTEPNGIDIDIEVDKDKELITKVISNKQKRFKPPLIEEVIEYFTELNSNNEEASKYYDYYTSNGWKVGNKATMKDWKASARNWIRNNKNWGKSTNKMPDFININKQLPKDEEVEMPF